MCYFILVGFQEVLDADETPLRNRRGVLMKRDIVQFVPFRELNSKNGANFSLVSWHHVHVQQHGVCVSVKITWFVSTLIANKPQQMSMA